MQCPSCGAISKKRSMKCPECGAFRTKTSAAPSQLSLSNQLSHDAAIADAATPSQNGSRQTRSLIEFPGARNARPQWRKELGERVRAVQERRLREAAIETGATEVASGADAAKAAPLELLPQAEALPLNPLVVAALRRIERAHVRARAGGNFTSFTGAAAVAYAEPPEFGSDGSSMADAASGAAHLEQNLTSQRSAAHSEKVHSLAVVPNLPSLPESSVVSVDASSTTERPRRLIGEDLNDPALNYLDNIPTAPGAGACETRTAPILLRIFASLIDLVVICLLSLVPLALVRLTDFSLPDLLVVTFAVGIAIVVAFLYLTICTALTGRTLGMSLFSLRVVDTRTRMIPTGSQSAGRAVLYLLSVAATGLPLMYTFIDRDQRAAHDRFTRTEVVRI